MNNTLIAQLLILFIITQSLGLVVGDFLVKENIHSTIVTDNPEDVENSFGLIAWILLFTAVLLALMKFGSEWLISLVLKGAEVLAVFGTTIIVLLPFTESGLAILGLALLLVLSRILLSKNVFLRNVSSVVAAAGGGALVGASLGVVPVIVFLVLLSVYDFIAVFKTKHMITLAKGITKKNLSFTFAMPTKEHQFELGTGDMVVPLAFSVSVLASTKAVFAYPYYFVPSIALLAASLAGLIATVHYASLEKGRALPALPLQAVLMLAVWLLVKLAGF